MNYKNILRLLSIVLFSLTCDETTLPKDCANVAGGIASMDECGICDDDPNNDNLTCGDCNGLINGTSVLDECSVCDTYSMYNINGTWDNAEPFDDTNGNGVWDDGEPFTDTGNGMWDSSEEYVDSNGDGIHNSFCSNGNFLTSESCVQAGHEWNLEEFTDSSNGVWDSGEHFYDANSNGVWDVAESFDDENENGIYDAEPFNDVNGNGLRDDAEIFDDLDGDGVWDNYEPFDDVNGNGVWDNYEPFDDVNGNGLRDDVEQFSKCIEGIYILICNDYTGLNDIDCNEQVAGDSCNDESFEDENGDGIYNSFCSNSNFLTSESCVQAGHEWKLEEFEDENGNDVWDARSTCENIIIYPIDNCQSIYSQTECIKLKNHEWFMDFEFEICSDWYDVDEDGIWDNIAEPFDDVNSNGVWDYAESFNDVDGDGIRSDETEPFEDENGNNIWDDAEPFNDENENGIWDNETFYDENENGVWDDAEVYIEQGTKPADYPYGRCDCEGVLDGTATIDNCEICTAGDTGLTPCVQDCAGEWSGTAENDDCGVCNGDNSTCEGCDGIPNSGLIIDCSGECGGDAIIDDCSICGGDNTSCLTGCTNETACNYDASINPSNDDGSCIFADPNYDCNGICIADLDCNNECGGGAAVDCSGECSGGNTGLISISLCGCFEEEYADNYYCDTSPNSCWGNAELGNCEEECIINIINDQASNPYTDIANPYYGYTFNVGCEYWGCIDENAPNYNSNATNCEDETDSCCSYTNYLKIQNIDTENSTFEIFMNNDIPVGGFQVDFTNVVLTGAIGGTAASANFSVSADNTTVIGFSFSSDTIPAGTGTLTNLTYSSNNLLCINSITISDGSGDALSFTIHHNSLCSE